MQTHIISSKYINIISILLAGIILGSCGEKKQTPRNTNSSQKQDIMIGLTDRIRDFGYSFNKIFGTDADEALSGTDGNDWILGRGGKDDIKGQNGDDYINGNSGDDQINGNMGGDVIHGGKGQDTIHGGQGNDWLYGDKDNDYVYGDKGDDRLTGGDHNDYLDGGPGNDLYFFKIGDGQDRINDTGGGNDSLFCIGFHQKGKIGKSGNRTSIHFPSGDSIVIENADKLENFVGCNASASTFADNSAPKMSSSSPAPETKGMCKIIGGAQDIQFEASITKSSCENECNLKEVSSPQRRCEFNGSIFRDHPQNRCLIVGIGGKVKYDVIQRKNLCHTKCASMTEPEHQYRKCSWGSDVLRDHPSE